MLMSARTARLVTSARQAARRAALICVLTGTGAAAVQARAPNNAIRGTTARLLRHLPVGRSVEKATIARLAPWHRRPLKKATMASAGPLPHVVRRLSAPRATTAVVAPSSSALRALTEAVKACQEVCDLRHANACMSGVLRLSVVMGSHPDVALVYSYDAGYRASGVFTVYPQGSPLQVYCSFSSESPYDGRGWTRVALEPSGSAQVLYYLSRTSGTPEGISTGSAGNIGPLFAGQYDQVLLVWGSNWIRFKVRTVVATTNVVSNRSRRLAVQVDFDFFAVSRNLRRSISDFASSDATLLGWVGGSDKAHFCKAASYGVFLAGCAPACTTTDT